VKPNPGYIPREAVGKRVNVKLANGRLASDWAADGRAGCRWSRRGDPFDIEEFEVAA
jgi:hypothetical protein